MSFSGITKLLNKKDKNKTKYNPSYDLIYSHNPLGKLVIIDMLNFIQIIRIKGLFKTRGGGRSTINDPNLNVFGVEFVGK